MKLSDLKQAVQAADPAAVLVPARILARVLQQVGKLPGFVLQVPHQKSFVLDRHVLFRHVEQEELDLEPDRLLPPTVILLARPSLEEIGSLKREPTLLDYWRYLFHANVHVELERRAADGKLTAEDIQTRIADIGLT